MATNGIIYGARGGNKYGPRLELHWSVVSQDIAKNTTKIKITSIFDVDATISYNGSNGKQGSTTAGGTTQTYTAPAPSSASQQTRTLGTTYHTIAHASDGTYTGTISGTFNLGSLNWGGTSLTTINASGSITLNTITRGINESSVTLATGWTDTTSSKTITFEKYSTTATVQILWRYYVSKTGGWSGQRVKNTSYTSGGALAFTTAEIDEMHNNNPTTKTVKVEVFIRHYQGSTLIGTVTKSATLNLKAQVPTLSLSIKCTGTNQALLGATTRGIQNLHSMTATATGTAFNGATITRYAISFQGSTTSASTTTRKITQAGTLTITATTWDSRGYTRTTSETITSYAYKPPTLTNIKALRYSGATVDPIGTDWKVTANVVISPIAPSGTNVNVATWKVDSGTAVNSTSVLQTGTLAIEYTKTLTIYYWDKFSGQKIYRVTIPTGQATFVLGKKSVGVGMVPPSNKEGIFIKKRIEVQGKRYTTYYPSNDANKVTDEWAVVSGANLPDGNFWYVNTIMYSDSRFKQIAYAYLDNRIFIRTHQDGKFTSWELVSENAEIKTTLTSMFAVGSPNGLMAYIVDGLVHLEGLVKKTEPTASGDVITTLPINARPKEMLIFQTISSAGPTQIRVMTNGEVVIYSTVPANYWISLSGISFIRV